MKLGGSLALCIASIIIPFLLDGCATQVSAGRQSPGFSPTELMFDGRSARATSSHRRLGSFIIQFDNGRSASLTNVELSRKGLAGEWLAVHGQSFEWQYRASRIRRVVEQQADMTFTDFFIDSLPIEGSERQRGNGRQVSSIAPCPVSVGRRTQSACCTMDACMPYPLGDCLTSMCGADPGDVLKGIVYSNPGGEFACEFDFDSGDVNCYDELASSDFQAPADLFKEIRATPADVTLTCYNPVNPGWGSATYQDPNQRGGHGYRLIPVGPGTHTWNFPVDFGPIFVGPIYPPVRPISMAASYYKFGIVGRLSTQAQGFCKGRLT